MRSLRPLLALVAVLSATPAPAPPAVPPSPTPPPATGSEEHLPWVEETARRLAALDGQLHRGEFAPALAAARAEVELGLAGGRAPALGLDEALARLALAEAGLGRAEDALWHWREALNLTPGVLSAAELAAFGAPGALLAAHPLRRAGEAPAGLAVRRASEAGVTPPRKVAGELPDPAAVRGGQPGVPPSARIEVVVDAEGRAREPVVVSGRRADLVVRALESLRGFRFAPATAGGAAVAVLDAVLVEPPSGRPLEAMLPAGSNLAPVAELLRAGRFPEAGRLATMRWNELLHGGERSADLLAAGLALRALAEAGMGQGDGRPAVCRWQAAQALSPALYDAGLTPYGAAGELLDRNRWGYERWVVHGAGRSAATRGAAPPPRRPRVLARVAPAYPRYLKARGTVDSVVLAGIVDAQGGLRQPELRAASATPNLDASALDALCAFRFQPANRGDGPVPSQYSVTMAFSPE